MKNHLTTKVGVAFDLLIVACVVVAIAMAGVGISTFLFPSA